MARGDPQIPYSIGYQPPSGGNIIVPGSGRSGPQIPYGIGPYLGGGGGMGRGAGQGGQLQDLLRRRRFPQETRRQGDYPEGQQPIVTPPPSPPPVPEGGVPYVPTNTPNPYQEEQRRWGVDPGPRHFVWPGMVGTGDYPGMDRWKEILRAQYRLGSAPVLQQRHRAQGQGIGLEDEGDMLRKLLRERMFGGG